MDQDDERHLFDLIINPAVQGLTGLSVPFAIVVAGIAVLNGRLLFILPIVVLLVLGSLDLFLFVMRFVLASSTDDGHSFHRHAFWLLLLSLFLSIAVIVTVFLGG